MEPGFARELRESVSLESLLADLQHWRWMFLMTALVMKCSIAAVERRHAVHGRFANPNKPWHMFAVDSVLSEARHQMMARGRLEEERRARLRAREREQLQQPHQCEFSR